MFQDPDGVTPIDDPGLFVAGFTKHGTGISK